MRYSQALGFTAGFLSACDAISLEKRDVPAVLGAETQRKQIDRPLLRDRLRRRANNIQVTLDNEDTLYFVNLTLGTPGQSLRLDIDTGSSDLWVNSANSQLCSSSRGYCAASGTFDANSSSSYDYLNSLFQIKYADGSTATGDYGTETLNIGGVKVTDMQFGIGYDSTSPQGILGIGYPTNEVIVQYTNGKTYPNLPQLLVQKGITGAPAYSLWLNDLDANTGSILFGGVDTDKYHGNLQTVPIIQENGIYQEFVVALTGIKTSGQNVLSGTAIPVLLDSGSSLSYLPNQYAQALFTILGARYQSDAQAAVVDCSLANSDVTVDFSFSGATISVPLNELVLVDGYNKGKPVCILGISEAGSSTAVLGDTFLRSAYVVYDLKNNEISLAATNFNATSSNIKDITNSTNGVPNATPVANAVSTLAVASGGARNGGGSPSVTALSSSGIAAKPTAIGSFGGYAAAAVAGAGVVFAL